jgi:hypothetical protein
MWVFWSFTKYISFFPLPFHLLSLISNNSKIILLSTHFPLTFFPLTIFPLTFFPLTFSCHPNKALEVNSHKKRKEILAIIQA